jgi:capsular exopolysaccharide synthesis family protein
MTTPNPLLEEMQRISSENQSGTLLLGKDQSLIKVFFDQGLISAASSDIPRYQIGKFLARSDFIAESGITDLLAEARKRSRILGEAAVHKNVLDNTELLEVVQDQAIQLLLLALQEGYEVRSFSPGPAPIYLPARMSLEQLMLELARRSLRPFQPDPHKMLVLSNGHDLSHLPWYPQELSVISKLKSPQTLQELAVSTGLEYGRLCKILSVLDSLKLVTSIEEPPSEVTAVVLRESLPFEHLVPEIQNNVLSDKMETFHNQASFVSEQFKTLKVRIMELSAARPLKLITVSSPHTAEGKSLVSANLAFTFSRDVGRKVLLIDCDLRNPTIHKYLGTSLEPGLKGYLETDYLLPYCYMRRFRRLFIMTAGGTASNPVELLSLEKMRNLMDYLRREFDTVILDAPPLAPISDAQIVSSISDGLVVVVRSGKTSYGNLERAFRTLDRNKLLGFVLNDVKPRMFHTQYYYKYYRYRGRSLYPYGAAKQRSRPKNYLE